MDTRPMIYMDEQEVTQIVPFDTARADRQGRFSFSGRLDYPRFFHIRLGGNNNLIPLLIAPGERIILTCHSNNFSTDYSINGSEGSEQIFLLNKQAMETTARLDSIIRILDDPLTDEAARQGLIELYSMIFQQQRKFSTSFILNHLQSMASIYALYQRIGGQDYILNENKDIQLLKITGQTLDTLYPYSKHVQALVADAGKLESQIKNLGYMQIMDKLEGKIPDISLPGTDGDTVRLSSLDDEVVLISFWASWNKLSVSHNLELKEIYNKYHRKGFEIYQVSLDNKKDAWINAIQYDEIPWINVSDLSSPNSPTALMYNITSLPVTFLLDQDRDVVGKNLTKAEMDSKLRELLD
jgi:peroxiredoxin